MLKTYQDFLARVNELGFMAFYGKFLEGFPMLETETAGAQWHTGDYETDPWQWKDRAAEEKQAAFGSNLGGYKGFISKRLYPLFFAAYRPAFEPEELHENGEMSDTAWQLYKLFAGDAILSTADIRGMLGVTKKTGAGKVDTALKELQREFILTVCGNKRKLSFDGLPYGWPANTYCRVEHWAPKEWLAGAESLSQNDARRRILDIGCSMGHGVDRSDLSKNLFGKWKEGAK